MVTHFLGNTKTEDYEKIVSDLLPQNGCKHVIKNSFFTLLFGFFPKNLGSVSDEHGERFHQDLKSYEGRYQDFGIKIG